MNNRNIKKLLREIEESLMNENMSSINFSKSFEEDEIQVVASIDNNKVGELSMEVLFDAYSYEFDDVFSEDFFYELYPDFKIIKISYIKVNDGYRNLGVGTSLMKYGMNLMKNKGYDQFYLNASPMGFNGLNTKDLVAFYKKFGFKELLNQGHNVLMGVVF